MKRCIDSSFGALALALLLVAAAAAQGVLANAEIDALLQRDEAPVGVLFEIVEGDEAALDELLPRVREAIRQLRARFPQTEFAVISHGREEFALQSRNEHKYADIHLQARSLVADDVALHVCGNHASWYDVSADDFPDYVEVAATAGEQIGTYLQMGYDLVVIGTLN